jgi:hypothetical protein
VDTDLHLHNIGYRLPGIALTNFGICGVLKGGPMRGIDQKAKLTWKLRGQNTPAGSW